MQETRNRGATAAGAGSRPLAGARGWLITDGKAGHEAQCLGLAEALGVEVHWKRVAPSGLWKTLAPWVPVSPRERFGLPQSAFAPPWPTIALAAGRTTIPYVRALKRRAGLKTFTVVLLDPRTGAGTADLVWVPMHDTLRGANVIATPTSPHRFSEQRLAEIRAQSDEAISALPEPRVGILIGGPNASYRYTEPVVARLIACVRSLAELGASLMITTSRRTPAEVAAALEEVARTSPSIFWRDGGESKANPYPQILANAQAFLVTADSINMTGEAAATGHPIYVFEPEGGAAKFRGFHEALRARGVTRGAPEKFREIGHWTYEPLSSAETIAREIERRWLRRKSMLGGLV
jgi:mitochondrial fission protein ELM1